MSRVEYQVMLTNLDNNIAIDYYIFLKHCNQMSQNILHIIYVTEYTSQLTNDTNMKKK
jgi:hypothetical protein